MKRFSTTFYPEIIRCKQVQQSNTVKLALCKLPFKIKNTGLVESTDYKSVEHHIVHFNRESQMVPGKRYGKTYHSLIKK